MPKLKSRLIVGTKPSAESLQRVKDMMKVPDNVSISLMVFEVTYNNKTYYCCWSGGEIRNGTPYLSALGQATMEALVALPMGSNDSLIIQELKLGQTPLKTKVKNTFARATPNSKICFVGDMAGELDGHIVKAFKLVSGEVIVGH